MSNKIEKIEYVSVNDESLIVSVYKVNKDTHVKNSEYGKLLVSSGNFILEFKTGNHKGSKVGITQTDLDLQYKLKT